MFEQDGVLTVEMPGQIETEFRDPNPDGRWVSALINCVSVLFEQDDSGKVTAMKGQDVDSL